MGGVEVLDLVHTEDPQGDDNELDWNISLQFRNRKYTTLSQKNSASFAGQRSALEDRVIFQLIMLSQILLDYNLLQVGILSYVEEEEIVIR